MAYTCEHMRPWKVSLLNAHSDQEQVQFQYAKVFLEYMSTLAFALTYTV